MTWGEVATLSGGAGFCVAGHSHSHRILAYLNEDELEIEIATSIGIALAPKHASDPDDLVRHADYALYCCKSGTSQGFTFYDASMAPPQAA